MKWIGAALFSFLLLQTLFAENYGSQHMVNELKSVLVKRPDNAFAVKDIAKWHYTSTPNVTIAQEEHDAFVAILQQEGVDVLYHDQFLPDLADSIYVHDPVIITDHGAIILQMGKPLRRGEEKAIESRLQELGIPIYFRMHGEGTAEGGDTLWLDEKTFLVGQSFRTNEEGFRQFVEALNPLGVDVIPVDLPYWEGKDACLHLQSLISLVDEKVAVVFKKYMAVNLIKLLENRGFDLIDVPEEEFMTMGPNILAIRPGVVLTIEGNPITKQRMEQKGIQVHTYQGNELSLKAEGGATCLTRPLWRVAAHILK